jgi:probable rRNA maturation factor
MLNGQFINLSHASKWTAYRSYTTRVHDAITHHLNLTKPHEYALVLVDEAHIHDINQTYRKLDKSTDVISFAALDRREPYASDIVELGDIFINVNAIETQAQAYQHSLKREFCFLLTHGLLHLFQYDHLNPEDEKRMFALQEDILNDIAKRRPYRKNHLQV